MVVDRESNLINGYRIAWDKAFDSLQGKDCAVIARNADARYDADCHALHLPYLGIEHRVDVRNREVFRVGPEGDVPVGTTAGVLMLHYLLQAVKHPLSGQMISFREVRGVSGYYPAFVKRAILPLQGAFAGREEALQAAGARLGGVMAPFGDTAITLHVFPLVPITYVLWRGDGEMPSSATILFDANVSFYLPGEDIVLAASFGTYALMKSMKQPG